MVAAQPCILIMAAGTGGHVFPALAIAGHLQSMGAQIEWLGTRQGMENELLSGKGMTLHPISVSGLKGSGVRRKLRAPFMLVTALWQALRVIRQIKPQCVLGMGGFVCGPGGLAAKMLGKPLLIHEQNAVAGLTNRILSRLANGVFEAFPNTFPASPNTFFTGNPLRDEIVSLHARPAKTADNSRPLRVLVLGGSQGAAAINSVIPPLLLNWQQSIRPEVWHQTGKRALTETLNAYAQHALSLDSKLRVEPFIIDMAAAYEWADVVICRSGASTVSELAAVGLPAVLVPYPYHSDQQQLHNANWLADGGGAIVMEQSQLSSESLIELLARFDANRQQLQEMASAARALAICNAGELIAGKCLEYAHV